MVAEETAENSIKERTAFDANIPLCGVRKYGNNQYGNNPVPTISK
jgi:hypothetical protein